MEPFLPVYFSKQQPIMDPKCSTKLDRILLFLAVLLFFSWHSQSFKKVQQKTLLPYLFDMNKLRSFVEIIQVWKIKNNFIFLPNKMKFNFLSATFLELKFSVFSSEFSHQQFWVSPLQIIHLLSAIYSSIIELQQSQLKIDVFISYFCPCIIDRTNVYGQNVCV